MFVAKGGQVMLSKSEVEGGVAGAGKLLLLVVAEIIVGELVNQGEEEVALVKDEHFLVAGRVRLEQGELEVVDINGFMEEQFREVKTEVML